MVTFFICFICLLLNIEHALSQCSATSAFGSCSPGFFYNGNVLFAPYSSLMDSVVVNPQHSSLSAGGKSSIRTILALYLAKDTYTGPCIKLRRSSDSATVDFYCDSRGAFGTAVGATGTSYDIWIGTDTAFVTQWYDQSGNANHATQTTTTSQPIFSIDNGYVDFKPSYFMIIPATFIPCTAAANEQYGAYTKIGAVVGGKKINLSWSSFFF
jgi:hypothetical protein